MSDEFEKWYQINMPVGYHQHFKRCWNAAIESTKPKCHDIEEFYRPTKFGCYYCTRGNKGIPWDYCALEKSDEYCDQYTDELTKENCEYWREIKED